MSAAEPTPGRRSPLMIAMFLGPVLVGGGLVAATAGWYLKVQDTAGEAAGAPFPVRFAADCGEARAPLEARMKDLGLHIEPDASAPAGTFGYTLRGPGMDDDATHLPAMLAAPGKLVLTKGGVPVELSPRDIGMQLAFSGTPVTLMVFPEPIPAEGLAVTLDGAPVEVESLSGVELQVASRAADSRTALRTATERVVQIRHPLPCAVRVAVGS